MVIITIYANAAIRTMLHSLGHLIITFGTKITSLLFARICIEFIGFRGLIPNFNISLVLDMSQVYFRMNAWVTEDG